MRNSPAQLNIGAIIALNALSRLYPCFQPYIFPTTPMVARDTYRDNNAIASVYIIICNSIFSSNHKDVSITFLNY